MSTKFRSAALLILLLLAQLTYAQSPIKGKVIDAVTKEPIYGASVNCCTNGKACMSNASGEFSLPASDTATMVLVSFVGYQSKQALVSANGVIALTPSNALLQEVVVTANRESVKRSEAPVAITTLSAKTIQDTKPVSIDQVLNKVSGVYMVNLGNEQHQMSIRQPMTTKSLFLYLEDGIPVRTTGLFNHNALLELNMTAVKNIEVIKGPSSSLYGSEAIGGVVNFITLAPTALPTAKISFQGNTIGYKRGDLKTAFTKGKWGFALSGYHAEKKRWPA